MIRITCHTDTLHCTTSRIRIVLGARAGYTAKHHPVDMRNVDCIRNFSKQKLQTSFCKAGGIRHSFIRSNSTEANM